MPLPLASRVKPMIRMVGRRTNCWSNISRPLASHWITLPTITCCFTVQTTRRLSIVATSITFTGISSSSEMTGPSRWQVVLASSAQDKDQHLTTPWCDPAKSSNSWPVECSSCSADGSVICKSWNPAKIIFGDLFVRSIFQTATWPLRCSVTSKAKFPSVLWYNGLQAAAEDETIHFDNSVKDLFK